MSYFYYEYEAVNKKFGLGIEILSSVLDCNRQQTSRSSAASIYDCQHCLDVGVWMGNGYDVKITVLRRFDPAEVFERSPVTSDQPIKACGLFKDFQEFIVSGHDPKVPDGFCAAAWASIFPYILSLSSGGECCWFNEKNVAIAACIDGLRPVIFKLERI